MGRPTECTPEVTAKVCEAIREGMYLEHAGPLVGVTYTTICNWRTWGAEGREPYASFLDAVKEAEAVFVQDNLGAIRGAQGGKDAAPWTNRAWLLERRMPRLYGRTVQEVEHSGTVGLLKVELPELPDLDADARLALIRAQGGRGAKP